MDGYLRHVRALRLAHARARRSDALEFFEGKAESARRRARSARRSARVARYLKLDPGMAAFFKATVELAVADAERAEAQVAALRDPNWTPPPGSLIEIAPHEWHRANEDRGHLALGGISVGNRSMLTDSDHPPSIDGTRRYGYRAGLRPPLARHQAELENAMPRDRNGSPLRLADPRAPYFRLVNDGGAQADPTRGINCQDCVLSFFDTYMHGRPRVSAPRTFDAYSEGDPQKPLYGEEIGLERVEHATGGRLQSLCPMVAREEPGVARQRVDRALADVSAQLLAGGHGSFAFLVNAWEGGSAHAWAAVNQNGEILFVDPQSGLVTGSQALYGHRGWPDPGNVVALDALVVNGQGIPMPFLDRPDGAWRPRRTTLPPPPPRPAPIYYSAAYRAAPAVDPSPDDRRTRAEQPDPHSLPEPNPRPEPPPRPDPTPPRPEPEPTRRPRPIPSPRQPVDRIAEALEPRPAPVDPIARALAPDTAPLRDAPAPRLAEDRSYREYMAHARRTHEENRRAEYAEYLMRIAHDQRAKVLELGWQADAALSAGATVQGEYLRAEARLTSEDAAALEARADSVLAGEFAPARVEVEPADWIRINDDVGTMAVGAVETGDRSALTGDDIPPPVEHSRPYGRRGGLRAPLAVHQLDLENAMPRAADGTVLRLADPRIGEWFGLANDGGPQADPTRGINCVDGVLSLFDTYLHGRPRVSAPRTFDSYAQGDPTRPLGAEDHGLARIEDTVRGEFQGLCPYVGGLDHRQAKQAVDTAMTNLHNHLYNAGHGAFAFIVTDSEEGTAHAWAAVNQGGTILFLDPQTGRLSEDVPLYTHTGRQNDGNVVSMDAVVVNGRGELAPLPYHRAGLWSRSSLEPTGAADDPGNTEPEGDFDPREAERQLLRSLPADDRQAIEESVREAEPVAARISAQLHEVVAELNDGGLHASMEVVHEEHRVKTADSLARSFAVESEFEMLDVSEFLSGVKDRVRFSVQLSEEGYVDAVESVLGRLGELGFQTDRIVNFWNGGGRHNGLNVTLRDSEGFLFELQFPTEISLSISDDTHLHYETLRLKLAPAHLRVDAFLKMLAMNKERYVASHQPDQLDRLPIDKTVDTTFERFIADEPSVWRTYALDLDRQSTSVEEALNHYGLTYDEVFPGTRSDDEDGRREIRLSGGPEVRPVGRDNQPDRLPGPIAGAVPGGNLERPPEGMDLRPGAGGSDALRRQVPGPDAGDRSGDGRTDRPGDAGNGASERGDPAEDVRGGRADGLAVRPTPDVTPSAD
ncbi:toxin glutamine deamidase domain-containing protein [Actinoplanes sp. NPDC049118]|uniref:toxin glutamine deamidase domain-containing protein n=1 Tax=Actinoplanes sp. NPDC049118 TaxID=3155769 RepID=UPI0033D1D4C4